MPWPLKRSYRLFSKIVHAHRKYIQNLNRGTLKQIMFQFIVRSVSVNSLASFATHFRSFRFHGSGSTGVSSSLTMTGVSPHARTTAPCGSGFSMMAIQASTTTSPLKKIYSTLITEMLPERQRITMYLKCFSLFYLFYIFCNSCKWG